MEDANPDDNDAVQAKKNEKDIFKSIAEAKGNEGIQGNASIRCTDKGEERAASSPTSKDSGTSRTNSGRSEAAATVNEGFQTILNDLNIFHLYPNILSLNTVMQISETSLTRGKPTSLKDISMHFIHNVMRANLKARSTSFASNETPTTENELESENTSNWDDLFSDASSSTLNSVSILDLITAVFLCSDTFLQQALMVKMSLCQFALPVLLPDYNNGSITFLLWAMRSVVHKWRPHSNEKYFEEAMVTTPMPMISFMRLGDCSISKSRVINTFSSENVFVHRNMECGNFPRKLANGLVEMCFYLPCGDPNLDIFPDIFTMFNLRGDVRNTPLQLDFLKKNSHAVFMFVEKIGQNECEFLSKAFDSNFSLFLVINPDKGNQNETKKSIAFLSNKLKLKRENVLALGAQNEVEINGYFQKTITQILKCDNTLKSLESIAKTAIDLNIAVDENNDECIQSQCLAQGIVNKVRDYGSDCFKSNMLPCQGQLWHDWSDIAKEQCRLKKRGVKSHASYFAELEEKKLNLRKQQFEKGLSDVVELFVSQLFKLPKKTKLYFLQWMKIELEELSRKTLLPLQENFKKLHEDPKRNKDKLNRLDKKLRESSLGLEHFMREIGQFYEASQACSQLSSPIRQLRAVVADLLLDGFPMELMDGEAGCIPVNWVTDVLSALRSKLGYDPRVFVLTVLGVQSSGKSTLLNVMFGLQFLVSCGRCTRGAFMQLLRIEDKLKTQLGYDFILVIDTEGLKSPELATLDDSYEHDNELATLVIGLSDSTLLNMMLQNTEEMKDILQIVVHALIRMRETGKKSNCLFVHQNAANVSVQNMNIVAHRNFLEVMNGMTAAAAKMENKDMYYRELSDVIDHNPNKDNWYISGLLNGSSCMAAVDHGYSECISNLKQCILEKLGDKKQPDTLSEFSKWVNNLWKAIKEENFIFNFKNFLFLDAYNKLCTMYANCEMEFRMSMIAWTEEEENKINNSQCAVIKHYESKLNAKVDVKISQHKDKIEMYLEKAFDKTADNVHLIVKYKKDFFTSCAQLCRDVKGETLARCTECISIQQNSHKYKEIQKQFTEKIVICAKELSKKYKATKTEITNEELKIEFSTMWEETVSKLSNSKKEIVDHDIKGDIENKLSAKVGDIHNRPSKIPLEPCQIGFKVNSEHVSKSANGSIAMFIAEIEEFSKQIIKECKSFIEDKDNYSIGYWPTHWDELLLKIENIYKRASDNSIPISKCFKVDMMYYMCSIALTHFKTKHNTFLEQNYSFDEVKKMEEIYFEMFKKLYQIAKYQKNVNIIAFCNDCLKHSFLTVIEQRLGAIIVSDMKQNDKVLSNRKHLLMELFLFTIKHSQIDFLYHFTKDAEHTTKQWMKDHVLQYCTNMDNKPQHQICSLKKTILDEITEKVKQALYNVTRNVTSITVSQILKSLKTNLEKDIVMHMDFIEIVDSYKLEDSRSVKQFCDEFIAAINKLSSDILGKCSESCHVEEMLNNLHVKPHLQLFKMLSGCGMECPLCGAPCDQGGSDHREHSAIMHYPQGVHGRQCDKSRTCVTEVCTMSVTKSRQSYEEAYTFVNEKTCGKKVEYRNYRSVNNYYKSWDIDVDLSMQEPLFWKFLFWNHNEKLVELYNFAPTNIPKEWEVSIKQVEDDLQERYATISTGSGGVSKWLYDRYSNAKHGIYSLFRWKN